MSEVVCKMPEKKEWMLWANLIKLNFIFVFLLHSNSQFVILIDIYVLYDNKKTQV